MKSGRVNKGEHDLWRHASEMNDKPKRNIFDCHIFDPAKIPCDEISDRNALVKEPLVSVKMITYNHEPYIAQAIEGVLQQQTDFPFELVIGEDCSTDETREIVFDYQKEHPDITRVITSDKNVGAKKNGLRTERACRGKYIAYCEGDDYWHHPQKLRKQIGFLESHSECGLVHSDVNVRDVITGNTIKNFNRFVQTTNGTFDDERQDLFFELLTRRYKIRTCTVCVRRHLLLEVIESDPIVFKSDRFMMGDIPRWLELSRITKLKYIDEPLATYNQLPESLSRSKDIRKHMKFKMSSFDVTLYYANKYGYIDRIPKYRWDHYTLPLLSYAYKYLNREMAIAVYERRNPLPFEQNLLYWGAVHSIVHLLVWPLVYSRKFMTKLMSVLRRESRISQ